MRSWCGTVGASLACALASALATPPPAHAACGKTERFAAKKDLGPGRAPLAVGDSVLLGAAEEAAAIGYDVDVRICRATSEGLDVIKARKRRNRLPHLTVVALGANSDFTTADVRTALRILGPDRMLGLVTPREVRGMSTGDAKTMRAAARRWPNRIALIDWVKNKFDESDQAAAGRVDEAFEAERLNVYFVGSNTYLANTCVFEPGSKGSKAFHLQYHENNEVSMAVLNKASLDHWFETFFYPVYIARNDSYRLEPIGPTKPFADRQKLAYLKAA